MARARHTRRSLAAFPLTHTAHPHKRNPTPQSLLPDTHHPTSKPRIAPATTAAMSPATTAAMSDRLDRTGTTHAHMYHVRCPPCSLSCGVIRPVSSVRCSGRGVARCSVSSSSI